MDWRSEPQKVPTPTDSGGNRMDIEDTWAKFRQSNFAQVETTYTVDGVNWYTDTRSGTWQGQATV